MNETNKINELNDPGAPYLKREGYFQLYRVFKKIILKRVIFEVDDLSLSD